MNPKFYALLTLSLVATVTLPVVNGKLSSLVPAVMAQNTDARKAEADQLLQLCRQNLDNNQVKLAIQSCQQAVIAYRQIKDLSGEAKSTANLGNAYVNDGQYRQAISVLENAVKIAQESKERRVEALAFLYLGGAYYELGEFKESIEFFQQTLTIAKEIKDADLEKIAEKLLVLMEAEKQRKEADKLFEQGVQQYEISQFREALQSWEKALKIYQEIKNRQGEAASLDNLGSAYLSLGQYQKAIDLHEKSLVINREIVNRQGEANSLNNLGNAYQSRGEYQTAIDYHQQSLDIRREIKDRQGEAASLNNLGNAYQSRGEYQTAIDYHQQSLDIRREIKDRQGEAASLNNLGLNYHLLGQYQKAINYHQQSLEIAEKIGDLKVQADSLGNLGNVYQSLGQYQKAIDDHQKSLDIAKKIGDQGSKARSLGNLGNAYQSLGQYQKAINYHRDSLAMARDIGLRQEEGSSLNNLGVAHYFLGEYEKAIDYLKQTLDIAKKIGDLKGEANSLNNLGVAYQKINQPAEAIKNLEESLNIILKIRGDISRENIAGQNRKSFLASNERTVITLAEVLIQQNQPEKAFQWLNLATTADLADYNRLINAKVADPDAQKALDNWNTDNRQLEGMRRQLQDKYSEELAQQIRQFEEKVYKNAETIGDKYPEIAELFETKPTDIAQLQKNIAPDTLVIQPVPLRDKVALFLVTREKLTVIQSDAKRDELNKLVSEYRTQLADRRNADYLVTGSKLYEILIRPIESQIATSSPKNIAIIATGQLRYIPFETLYDKKNDQVLLEKYPIYYLTRISTSTPPATERKPLQGLAFANPKPTQEELKGTEIEAETISKTFPGSEKYLGEKATLDTFKIQAARFSILHLGTHGCFKRAGCPNLGMQANTILFANKEQYNIADAALLGLKNTELITLSACQTAKEANADGQEISGLAYVLERAGAKSVIASLWNAEDNTSAEIMTQFYQNLKNGMTKSEAMRQAKLSQIKSHPYFWSPFILIGAAN
ncbi:MAG: CHAT domain-containing protein [Microcystis flos-aquae TF09]|uniref:CHAT domain-containing protein n=1 Tax=Microcystis flos-aquae TF09 TaxID=2060473 RepID=A0A3E0LC78_9CHRO|nr:MULTISPECIES: tetratricopeptide repeat protein [unclassified Microcystis]MCA2625668.1 tetratricopeptide repeat protein [Microcystis sp. M19BS1]MCA2633876.1 tetratricopeptide repeat protein [Microcystis sp. M20BS1]REJ44897.1 MAG: CHAT domain-containing protein [Microcystis flos-aquae TF09]